MFTSSCGDFDLCGATVTGQLDLTLIDASLTQTGAIIVGGTANLRVVDAVDDTQIGIGTICLTGADCDTDGLNDNDFQGTVNASAQSIEIVDANDLTTGTITAINQVWLAAGDSDLTPGDGTDGLLTLTGNVTGRQPSW